MERFFRRFKCEWMPKQGDVDFQIGIRSSNQYILGYYHKERPHQHNAGWSLIEAEQDYWKTYHKLVSFS